MRLLWSANSQSRVGFLWIPLPRMLQEKEKKKETEKAICCWTLSVRTPSSVLPADSHSCIREGEKSGEELGKIDVICDNHQRSCFDTVSGTQLVSVVKPSLPLANAHTALVPRSELFKRVQAPLS